jgi:hypothetical protein
MSDIICHIFLFHRHRSSLHRSGKLHLSRPTHLICPAYSVSKIAEVESNMDHEIICYIRCFLIFYPVRWLWGGIESELGGHDWVEYAHCRSSFATGYQHSLHALGCWFVKKNQCSRES